MLSYHRETALQGALVLAKRGRLELGDNTEYLAATERSSVVCTPKVLSCTSFVSFKQVSH